MSDISARIARYRNEVRHGADLEVAASVFLDTLACDCAFMALGRQHDDSRLREIIVASLSRVIGRELALIDVRLTRIGDARFVHGAAAAVFTGEPTREPVILAIAYFEEDDRGLCVAFRGENEATFVRFTAHALTGPAINSPLGIA